MAAHGGAAIRFLEFQKGRGVDDAGNHAPHVHRGLEVGREEVQQAFGVLQRRGAIGPDHALGLPAQRRHQLARHADAVRIVFGHVLGQTRHTGVHVGTAQGFVVGHFACGRFQEWRPGQKGAAPATHHDHVVRQTRHVRTACGGRPVHNGNDRDARRRQPGQVVEIAPAVDELLDLVLQQVGPGRLDQVNEGQAVVERDLLRALQLLQPHGLQRARVDAAVVGDDQRPRARDQADAHDLPTPCGGLVGVGRVLQPTCERREFQKRRARVQQALHPLARQQLAAFGIQRARLCAARTRARFDAAPLRDHRQHVFPVGVHGASWSTRGVVAR